MGRTDLGMTIIIPTNYKDFLKDSSTAIHIKRLDV